MPQHLMLNTKHVSTYVTLRHFRVTFPSLSSSLCELNSISGVWGSTEARGMRRPACQALCWKLSQTPTCLSAHVASLIVACDNLSKATLGSPLHHSCNSVLLSPRKIHSRLSGIVAMSSLEHLIS